MRPFIIFLKKVGLQKIVGLFIALVLIIGASIYFSTRPNTLSTEHQEMFDQAKYSKTIPELEEWIQSHPDDLNMMELLAASYIQKADAEPTNAKLELTKAIKILNQMVTKDPRRSEVYRLLGTARLYQNNIPSAEASFNQSVKISKGQNLNAKVGQGMIFEHKNEWDKASGIYNSVLKEDSANEMATLGMGRYYIHKENPSLAKRVINTLLLSAKNNAVTGEAYAILGSANMIAKDFVGAIENFKKSLTYRPGNVHTAVLLGDALIERYRLSPKEGRADLLTQITDTANKAILIKPDYIYAYALLYKVNLLQNKYPEANQIGKKIVSLLESDTVLTQAEKETYAKFYSGEIKSVTITSIKKTTVNGSSTSGTPSTNATTPKSTSPFKGTTNNLKK